MVDQSPEQQTLPGVTAAVRLPRLTTPRPRETPAPTFAELGLAPLEKVCKEWQFDRAGSTFWELNIGGRMDAWREIPVLMGSTAESALLAGAAQVEIECLRSAIQAGDVEQEYGLAQRFFAEAQGQQILGCGHRLANIGVRVMMLAPGYPWGADVCLPRPVAPFSDHPEDWISMSKMPSFRRSAAASPYPALVTLATVVINLSGSEQWARIERLRGSEFHRARQESPFVAGARHTSVWRVEGQTRILEPADDVPTAAEVERWLADLGREAADALRALPRFMRDFRVALADAVEEITNGTFRMGSS
jgi:hypothetical protein